jgi:hypothetical protein
LDLQHDPPNKCSNWDQPLLQLDGNIPNPANPQSWNRFGYVLNNPIRFNEPTRLVCSDPDAFWPPSCDGEGISPPNIQALLLMLLLFLPIPIHSIPGLRMDRDYDCGVICGAGERWFMEWAEYMLKQPSTPVFADTAQVDFWIIQEVGMKTAGTGWGNLAFDISYIGS